MIITSDWQNLTATSVRAEKIVEASLRTEENRIQTKSIQ